MERGETFDTVTIVAVEFLFKKLFPIVVCVVVVVAVPGCIIIMLADRDREDSIEISAQLPGFLGFSCSPNCFFFR